MAKRYFVTIDAKTDQAWDDLGETDLDLLHPTGAKRRRGGRIQALVTMAEVESLVDEGYEVMVQESAAKRSRARETVGFQEWLETL